MVSEKQMILNATVIDLQRGLLKTVKGSYRRFSFMEGIGISHYQSFSMTFEGDPGALVEPHALIPLLH